HEEGGLKGVLAIGEVAKHPPAHAEDHRPVPLQDRGKGRLIPLGDNTVHEPLIRSLLAAAGFQAAEPLDQLPQPSPSPRKHAPRGLTHTVSTPSPRVHYFRKNPGNRHRNTVLPIRPSVLFAELCRRLSPGNGYGIIQHDEMRTGL